jgi:hypothetical protein
MPGIEPRLSVIQLLAAFILSGDLELMNAVHMCADFTVSCGMVVYIFSRFALCLPYGTVGDRQWPTFVMNSRYSAHPINFYCAMFYNILQVHNSDCPCIWLNRHIKATFRSSRACIKQLHGSYGKLNFHSHPTLCCVTTFRPLRERGAREIILGDNCNNYKALPQINLISWSPDIHQERNGQLRSTRMTKKTCLGFTQFKTMSTVSLC